MKKQIETILLAALVGGTASGALAQQRQPTGSRPTFERSEFRTPIPRSVIHGELNGGQLIAVKMLNHNNGWAIGSGRPHTILFRTDDGGKSWERQTTLDGDGSTLNDIGFADANNGWIVGNGHILRTTDGGESWSPVDPWLKGYPPDATELLVLGPDAIIVGTRGENRQIVRTLDGGATWDMVGLVKDGGGGAGSENSVTGLALAGGSTVFATTGSHPYSKGRIYRSDDGGHSWESVAEAVTPLHGIAFRGKRGVAVGEGIAFWTDDGGDTWRRAAMPGRRYAVDFISDNAVLAVGSEPSVVISGNGGKTWQAAPGPVIETGSLVAIAGVDFGWVFMASTHALHHYIDPSHTEPIASGSIPIPVDVQLPGGRALPRGLYDVMLGHRGDKHVLKLDRKGDVPAEGQASAGGQGSAAGRGATGSTADGQQEASAGLDAAVARQKSQKPPPCTQPCSATLPVGVTYEKEDAAGKDLSSFFRISLEPTASGVAVVVRTAVTPPRNVALALAAVGAPQSSEKEATQVATKTAGKVGGLFGRIQKAAAGDLRGAAAGSGVNPQATQKRLRAAKAAPPAVYKVTVRHTFDVFGEKKN